MSRPVLVGLALVSVTTFVPFDLAEATVVVPLSLEGLVERSDVVARVRVGATVVVATDRGPFRITTLEVLEPFRGVVGAGERIALWQRGDGRSFVLGDPVLDEGEEGIAFLVLEGDRAYLTALAQAWWRRDAAATEMARRDLSGLRFAGDADGAPPSEIPWRQLREALRSACGGAAR